MAMANSLALDHSIQFNVFYNIMADGTVKQVNPFTGTEVWSVPGRSSKPITNEIPPNAKRSKNILRKIIAASARVACSKCRPKRHGSSSVMVTSKL